MSARRFSMQSVLVMISLILLLMPLGGIYYLRIYQSALIRQTESELISQAAFAAAMYKQQVQTGLGNTIGYGIPLPPDAVAKQPLGMIPAKLDLARDRIYPSRPAPHPAMMTLDPIARQAGERILPVLKDAQHITLSGMKILDYRGIVVAGQGEMDQSFAHTDEFLQAKTGRPVSLMRRRQMPFAAAALDSPSRNASVNVYVALPVVLDNRLIGVVWVNRTPNDVAQTLYGKRRELIWTAALMLLSVLAIAALASYTITQPIRALVSKNRLIALGDPAGFEPLENPITREIAELSESISTMAKTIQHRSEYIRNFAAHVSHEFKTPLTAIQGSVELLQDNLNQMPREQQERFLANIAQDTDRLRALVSRLLELAKADMAEPLGEQATLAPVLTDLAARYATETFAVTLDGAEADLAVPMCSESLEAVLSNLLDNSRQAGATAVSITCRSEADTVVLDVADNGPGISEGNRREIFTPFFTTRRASGGTGLGLCITQSLLERHGGTVALHPADGGTCFRITLPQA